VSVWWGAPWCPPPDGRSLLGIRPERSSEDRPTLHLSAWLDTVEDDDDGCCCCCCPGYGCCCWCRTERPWMMDCCSDECVGCRVVEDDSTAEPRDDWPELPPAPLTTLPLQDDASTTINK